MLYPNPDRTREFMKRIPDHLYRLDYGEIKIDCNHNLPAIPISVVDFTNEPFFFKQYDRVDRRNLIYRARLLDEDQRRYSNVSEISYVPKEYQHKIGWGRVNKPHEAMFYGALNYITACAESVIDARDIQKTGQARFIVGIWEFKSPLLFAQIPYSEKYFKLFYDTVDYESESIQLRHVQNLNSKLKSGFEDIEYEVLQFFSDEFARFETEPNYYYKLSNYYADRIFGRIPEFVLPGNIHGILYPSITLSYQHKNLVLKTDVVDQHLKFVSAMDMWMVKNRTGGADFIPLKQNVSADENGNILWDTTGSGRF